MNFIDLCEQRFKKLNTVLCIGLDPVIEKIPLKKNDNVEKTLTDFYFSLLENFHSFALAVKPNMAFYEQYGIGGLSALKKIIKKAKEYNIPVILDAKRGDIGETAAAYARACFTELEADAVTLSPYLGLDSMLPFFEYKDKGFFLLCRTSNKGSADLQLLELKGGNPLYREVAEKAAQWNTLYSKGIGIVAGATHTDELKNILNIYSSRNYPPILIPGVGKQGGDFESVIKLLKAFNYPLYKIFINSSSKINYAYLDHPDLNYLDASLLEIKKMMIKK
jgi:orotidine-5'-phosphate decarboxylase